MGKDMRLLSSTLPFAVPDIDIVRRPRQLSTAAQTKLLHPYCINYTLTSRNLQDIFLSTANMLLWVISYDIHCAFQKEEKHI
jgi:hypothetical protein